MKCVFSFLGTFVCYNYHIEVFKLSPLDYLCYYWLFLLLLIIDYLCYYWLIVLLLIDAPNYSKSLCEYMIACTACKIKNICAFISPVVYNSQNSLNQHMAIYWKRDRLKKLFSVMCWTQI